MAAAPRLHHTRVAGNQANLLRRYTETVGNDLRERGLVALASRLRARDTLDDAVGLDGPKPLTPWSGHSTSPRPGSV